MATDEQRTPKIDRRSADDVVREAEAMLVALSEGAWQPSPASELDPLGALVRIFGDMAARAIDAVNAVPDAAQGAFLELLGVRPEPPSPARVPLTFALTEGASDEGVVAAGTQIGATAESDDPESAEIIFETERELVVTRSRLTAGFVHEGRVDRLDEVTAIIGGATAGPFELFSPRARGVHELYFACEAALERVGVTSVVAHFEIDRAAALAAMNLRWSIWDGASWREVAATPERVDQGNKRFYRATIADLPAMPRCRVGDHERAWLRARLDVEPQVTLEPTSGAQAVAAFPRLRLARVDAISAGGGIRPRAAVRGATKLDPTLDLLPFGELPASGAVFYVDGGDALAQAAGTAVTVNVALALARQGQGNAPAASADLRLIWELAAEGGGWLEIGRSSASDDAIGDQNPHHFSDQTLALTRAGEVTFTLPAIVPERKVAGQKGRFLRVRLAVGDYGAPERVAYKGDTKTWEVVAATLRPPVIEAPIFAYRHEVEGLAVGPCLKGNLGCVAEITEELAAGFHTVFTGKPAEVPGIGDEPALYLAFDRAFAPRPVDLFALIDPPDPKDTQPPEAMPTPGERPRILWEHLGPAGWVSLGVRDETDAFRDRGLVRFIGPAKMQEAELFGRRGVWLRARLVAGAFRSPPRVGRLLLNTSWASHALTRRGEILGSSSGAPGQVVRTVAAPVLGGERLEVRERADLSDFDLPALIAEVGEEHLTIERRSDGTLAAVWIRWTPIAHFEASGPSDRVYVLDAATGVITFGDGRHGKVPPRGDANLRMALYRTGGGTRGNRPIGAVNALKTTIRFVDAVTNHVAASGGSAREDDARVRSRGPRLLRHRGRAVTAQDFHDLALEAAQEVMRTHVLTAKFNPIDVVLDLSALDTDAEEAPKTDARGWVVTAGVPDDTAEVGARAADVRVIIVPQSAADQPVPSLGLLERVESYLRERCPPTTRLAVSGPRWIKVTVRVDLVPEADAAADRLSQEVEAAITRFLHPLTGGELGEGWDFGRLPRRSHLYRWISQIAGVSHIRDVELVTDPPVPADTEAIDEALQRALAGALIYSGDHEIVLSVPTTEVD